MIIKGSSRAAPSQLANHLKRADTNERVEVLELQSPHGDLAEALRDWQFLAAGTRGTKGLYHANIDPAEAYAMTAEQWARSVEVLEEELGLQGQPRAVVLHEKHGRQHIHVVWARTDIDTMTLRSDSQNYKAHERASGRLELEFGHEHVPGKHEKRDRAAQEEPPRSEVTHAEWQQAERTGIDPRERKSHVTTLYEQSDSGLAFKAALEESGYLIAKGDRRDFILVDEQGEIHSLGRQIKGVKAAELRAFMADIDREALPTATEARAQQAVRDEVRGPPQEDPPAREDAPEQEAIGDAAARDEGEERLRAALAERHEQERQEMQTRHRVEAERLDSDHEDEAASDLDRFAAEEDGQNQAEQEPKPALFARLWQRVKEAFSADARRAREAEERRRAAARAAERERARRTFLANQGSRRDLAREDLRVRHAEDLRKLAEVQAADLARRLADQQRAAQIAQDLAQERMRQQIAQERDGPERGPPGTR